MSEIKYPYSYNNHYKWGFNDNWFNPPEIEGFFQVSLGSCSRPHLSFREECIKSAELLGNQMNKPILVGLSGGIDSQAVCLSMMQAKVPFTPVILQKRNGRGVLYNKYDIDGAFDFCKLHNLTPIVESMDLDYFYTNELMGLCEDYGFTHAEVPVQLHLVKKYKDTNCYINGGGDPTFHIHRNNETNETNLTYKLGPTPIVQYLIQNEISGCMKFFMYTPEQVASYFDHQIVHILNDIRNCFTDGNIYHYWTYSLKPMMYSMEFPELIFRKKNTGFEKYPFMRVVNKFTYKMYEHLNPKAKMVTWKYEDLLQHLNCSEGQVKTFRSVDERNYY
jgi:hypothetical protein